SIHHRWSQKAARSDLHEPSLHHLSVANRQCPLARCWADRFLLMSPTKGQFCHWHR
ncbi:hypothetical protein VCCP1035_1668B, partial [Vibrio cholerae CP1035(8)]